jgi:NADH-quinone oxidoreductase subunit G
MRRNGTRLALAGDRPTALDGGAAAVKRYAPGGATLFLSELAAALRLGSEAGEAAEVAGALRGAERIVVLWGERIGREGEGALRALLDVAAALGLERKEGSGLLEIPELSNARGLREAGCLPDAGPGLSDAPAGRSTEAIREALESGELRSLLLFGVDPLRDFPDTEAWSRALAAADHIVCFSTFDNATTAMSDVVFPLETHAEKDGTVTHPDGRIQRVRPSAGRPGDIRPNVGVLAELSLALGHDTGIASQPDAFEALTRAVPFYSGITDAEIGGRGVRWQERPSTSSFPSLDPGFGPSRDRGADSPDSLHAAPSDLTQASSAARGGASAEAPSLALGTYRDLWAGPITELNPPLRFLEPRQRVELSPADAQRLGLSNGEEASVAQNGTRVQAEVVVRERVQEGVCFLIEGVAQGNANSLLNGGPVSVTVEKAAP